MKQVLLRIAMVLTTVFLLISVSLVFTTAGVFFSNMSNGVSSIESLGDKDLKKNLSVNGKVYYVDTVLAEEYNGNNTSDVLYYYYLVDFDDENEIYMIVKVKAGSELDESLENLYYADMDEGKDYEYLLSDGVAIDGYLIENDKDVVNEYRSWIDDLSDYGFDMSNANLASYTLDCTEPVSDICNEFIGGVVFVIVSAGLLILFVYLSAKASKNRNVQTPVYTSGFTGYTGQPNNYAQNNPSFQQNGYIPNSPNVQQNGYIQNNPNVQQNGYIPNNPNVQQNGCIPNNPNVQQNGYIPNNPNVQQNGYSQNNQSFNPQSQNSYAGGSSDKVSLKKEDY